MLSTAIDIPDWLETDRRIDWPTRAARDRAIATSFSRTTTAPIDRVLKWWGVLEREPDPNAPGSSVAQLFRRLSWVLVLLGAISGAGLAGAVLHYDGSQPINVLVVLGWLVVLPLVFFVLSLLLPFLNTSSFAAATNVGAIALSFLKRNSVPARTFFASIDGSVQRDKLLRWRIMLGSQQFGFAFSIAALIVLLLRVSFSDLAFGWSTTLAFGPETLHHALNIIAMPWSGVIPEATPSRELVEASRFFRLDDARKPLSAELLTSWWMFIAMCLLVFGVLLRAIGLIVANVGFNRATRGFLLGHSEVTALLDRLDTPHLTGTAQTEENARRPGADNAQSFDQNVSADLVIVWNDAPIGDRDKASLSAGGERALEADLAVLADLKPPSNGVLHLVTKAWEPPLLDLHDYIAMLREHFGHDVSIVVRPIGPLGAPADDHDVAVWRRSMATLNDAAVYVT